MHSVKSVLVAMLSLAMLSGSSVAGGTQEEATTGPSSQRSDLLPGVTLRLQEIEPGTFRVADDGVRALSWPVIPWDLHRHSPPGGAYWLGARRIHVVANDEGVWIATPEGIVRLGEEEPVWTAREGRPFYPQWLKVGPDGTMYQPPSSTILGETFWGRVSVPRLRGFRYPSPHGVTDMLFAPDGTLWVEGLTPKKAGTSRARLARRDPDGWSVVNLPLPRANMRSWPAVEELQATGDGALYVRRAGRFVQRYDGKRWETLRLPTHVIAGLHVGRDGTVWTSSFGPGRRMLVHRLHGDDTGWRTYELDIHAEHPGATTAERWHPGRLPVTGPDGSLWFFAGDGDREDGLCGGLARFDGATETRFLRDLCVYDIAFGPGGDAWILAGRWTGSVWDPDDVGPVEPYLIPAGSLTPVEKHQSERSSLPDAG